MHLLAFSVWQPFRPCHAVPRISAAEAALAAWQAFKAGGRQVMPDFPARTCRGRDPDATHWVSQRG